MNILKEQVEALLQACQHHFSESIEDTLIDLNELTIDVHSKDITKVSLILRNQLEFDTLLDVCAVDYLHYGLAEWDTQSTTQTGFSRAVTRLHPDHFEEAPQKVSVKSPWKKPRFCVVYHLLSVEKNRRVRVQSFLNEDHLEIDSVTPIWASANWFEREAFDLFGIVFKGHPDLRRILTDYGFVGHPFRKDFPLIGHVEMRYDAAAQKCIYEPVSIQPRVTVPKVIRDDHRYTQPQKLPSESV